MPDRALRWRALWLALGWTIAAGIVWLSLAPSPPSLDFTLGDKAGHLVGYGTLMFWFCQLYGARRERLGYALGFAAMGVALEFLQDATGYRSYEVADMFANALGVALGWVLGRLVGDRILAGIEAALRTRA